MFRRPRLRRLGFRDMMSRGHLMPGVEALRMAQSSLRCRVVDDVYTTMHDGSARAIELDRVSCPVLVARGERDRVLPPTATPSTSARASAASSSGCCRGSGTCRGGTTLR